ncbi:MAG: hypothetical protein E7098_07000 [Mediterranea massiliensis]|nr:hypothetical protein [Mediterranea massiliensis]
MKKIIITLFALAMMLPAKAQMTPEAVMGMTPDLPSTAALLNYWKNHNDPFHNEYPNSDLLNEFMEAWNTANDQIQDMQEKTLASGMKKNAMAGLVAGTNKTAGEVANMSEAEAKALAMSTMKGRISSMGLSQADFAKLQGGNLSDEEAMAMASKVMAKQMGGLTAKDIEAMSHMSDEERAAFMQESGLGESMTAKMNADKGKRASSQKQYQLATELISLGQKEHSLQQKAIEMIESAKKEGVALFDRKYRKADAEYQAQISRANFEAEEAISAADVKAAQARLRAAQSGWFNNMSRFYAEYIPMYRDAVAGAMDCCRAQLLPVKRQHKEVMEKLYALTRSAEYALSDSVPFEASSMYFELSEKITEFELEDELYKE